MGDHRVNIKIEFEMHGHKTKHDMWVNWSGAVPASISDWIETQKDKAMEIWFEAEDLEAERKAATVENAEREQLAKLKAKYEV
jgi:hypothetical protein